MKKFSLKSNASLYSAEKEAAVFLKEANVEEAATDARLLLEKTTGISGSRLFLSRAEKMADTAREDFVSMVNKRADRIPLQHITGEAWFYGRRFFVDKNVLIPRMDTEILVEEALKHIDGGSRVLELCTGSGCIAISVSLEKGICVTASDISEKAILVAKKNAEMNAADCEFILSDVFECISGSFDLIIANPPYIKSDEIKKLSIEVREHDPHLALDGGVDGLDFYRRIANESGKYLSTGGKLCLEIGFDQGEEVKELLETAGFGNINIIEDLNRLPRVISASLR